jgi:hypothetical protein
MAGPDKARKTDRHTSAKYVRLMHSDRHDDSAICHLATIRLTRIACHWRTAQRYQLRDTDGRLITEDVGHQIVRNITRSIP